jgi:hypothetical protein
MVMGTREEDGSPVLAPAPSPTSIFQVRACGELRKGLLGRGQSLVHIYISGHQHCDT